MIAALSSVTTVGINSQFANIMPNVFGYSSSGTAALISIAGIVSLVAILAAGRWMRRAGPMAAFSVGTAFRLVGAAGMAVLGMTGSLPLLAGVFAIVLMSLGRSISKLGQPALAFGFATVRGCRPRLPLRGIGPWRLRRQPGMRFRLRRVRLQLGELDRCGRRCGRARDPHRQAPAGVPGRGQTPGGRMTFLEPNVRSRRVG